MTERNVTYFEELSYRMVRLANPKSAEEVSSLETNRRVKIVARDWGHSPRRILSYFGRVSVLPEGHQLITQGPPILQTAIHFTRSLGEHLTET